MHLTWHQGIVASLCSTKTLPWGKARVRGFTLCFEKSKGTNLDLEEHFLLLEEFSDTPHHLIYQAKQESITLPKVALLPNSAT